MEDTKVDDDDDELMYADLVQAKTTSEQDDALEGSQREIMQATVDPYAWKTEVERVAPRLKVKANYSGKEWRSHLEQTKGHESVRHLLLH